MKRHIVVTISSILLMLSATRLRAEPSESLFLRTSATRLRQNVSISKGNFLETGD